MELLQLQYFFDTSKNESFAKTAEKYLVPSSSVSASVRRLEEELGCLLFERINHTITLTERGRELLAYAHQVRALTDEFKENLINSKGFCLPHFKELTDGAFKYLSKKKAIEFLEIIYEKEKEELKRLKDEVHKFTLKFDYRNAGEKWGSEIDAPKRAIEKLASYIEAPEENDK